MACLCGTAGASALPRRPVAVDVQVVIWTLFMHAEREKNRQQKERRALTNQSNESQERAESPSHPGEQVGQRNIKPQDVCVYELT